MQSEFYIKQLFNLPPDRQFQIKGDGQGWLVCISPEHAGGFESSASAKINLAEGSPFLGRYWCFGCKCKMGWNDFARRMHLDLADDDYQGLKHRPLGFKRGEVAAVKHKPTTFRWPDTKDWRGVPGTIVRQLGGYVYKTKDVLNEQMLIFPVLMHGEEVGQVRALMRDPKRNRQGKKIEESYLNSKGSWNMHALFGYDIAMTQRGKPLWLVEGPRDLCRALEAGVRVCCLLGSKFGAERAELIRLLNPPCLIIGTDNDDAGNSAAESILELCGDFVPIIRAKWPKGQDVFNQTLERLRFYDRRALERYGKKKVVIHGSNRIHLKRAG